MFKMGKLGPSGESQQNINYDVPQDYDPFHRIKNLKDKDKTLISASEGKAKHKIQSIAKRSDLLGEGKLANRFVSATSVSSNNFVRSGQ